MVRTGRRNPPARASIPSGPRSSAPTTRRTTPGLPASARNARPSGRARMSGPSSGMTTPRTPGAGRPPHEPRPPDTHHRPSAGTRRARARPRGAPPGAPQQDRTHARCGGRRGAVPRRVLHRPLRANILMATPTPPGAAVNHMIRGGLIEEHAATGPEGNTFMVLTATERGRDAAQRAAVDAGHVPEQQTWSGMVKPAELSHDTAVYRAALDERARIEAEGGRVTRVRLDAELKQIVATATEKARAEGGDRAARRGEARNRPRPRVARRQRGPRVVSRRPARHRGRRWCERPGERGDCVRPLSRGGDRGESRRRLCPAREQSIRHPDDRPRARPRNRRRPRRRTLAARPRWIGGAVDDATHCCRRRVDRHDPGPHGATRRPAVRVPRPTHPRCSRGVLAERSRRTARSPC